MAGFVKGDVVIVPFPYTDQDVGGKIRPGLVLAVMPADAPAPPTNQVLILCAVTTHAPRTAEEIPLEPGVDFIRGRIRDRSTIRPARLWTIQADRVVRWAGTVTPAKLADATTALVRLLTR